MDIDHARALHNKIWATRARIGILVLFLLGFAASCAPANPPQQASAVPTTAIPTPTLEPPVPETALQNALQRFTGIQSFTITGSSNVKASNANDWTGASKTFVDQANQNTYHTSNTSFDWDEDTQKLCIASACYSADATGVLKPVQSKYRTYHPYLDSLSTDAAEVLDSKYTYLGEDTVEGVKVFKYELQISKEMIDEFKDPPAPGVSASILIEPYPVLTLYVNAEDGYLVKTVEIFNSKYDFSETEFHYEIENTFSGWNTTTFTIPEHIDAQNTELQDYAGKYANLLSFQYPKVYSLSEIYGYPMLKTPSGSKMDLRIFTTIASLSRLEGNERDQKTSVAVCNGVVSVWLLGSFAGSPVIESTDWYQVGNLDFCKTVITTESNQIAQYLFNEPLDFMRANGRMLPVTYSIRVTPVEGEDADTLFNDVINTIKIGSE